MASEKQEISDRATARSMTNYLKTVKDSKENKYSIVGASDRVGKQAAVSTSFSIKYYGEILLQYNAAEFLGLKEEKII